MAASGWCIVAVFSLILFISGKSEDVQVTNTKWPEKHNQNKDVNDATNLPLEIADTAKKKSILNSGKHVRATQSSNPYHSRSHNEISSRSFLQWQSLLQISGHRIKRRKRNVKREVKELQNKTNKGKELQGVSLDKAKTDTNLRTSQTVSPAESPKTKEEANNSILINNQKENASKVGATKQTTNEGVTPPIAQNSSTLKSDHCANQTNPAPLEIITKFSSQDSMWAVLSLSILLFIMFGVVWYSKMWRKYPEFYETYGSGSGTAADTSTEMAWSKYGHTTTVSLKEIIQSKKQFFHELQMKIKQKLKNNNEHKGSGRNHTAKYSKLRILPNDIDEDSDDEDVLFKKL